MINTLKIIFCVLILYSCCSHVNKKLPKPEIELKNESEESIIASKGYPKELDMQIKTILPESATFWFLHEMYLSSWPEQYKEIIEKYFCDDEEDLKYLSPEDFSIYTINDSLELIIDSGSYRTGSSGSHNYVYNTKSKKFLCMAVGFVPGIVKAPGFVGFVFQFRYIDENKAGNYESYQSLEAIYGDKVITKAILTPNVFEKRGEQEIHFGYYKQHYFQDQVK